jgi:hypothetical protein
MMLEDDLRSTFAERAGEPAVQPDLLDEVRGGIRRANRRRAAALGAAALLVAAIAVPVALTGDRSPEPPATAWRKPSLEPLPFPFTPAWTPPGVGAGRVEQAGPNAVLSYDDSPSGQLQVEVGPKPGAWEAEGEDRTATVNGHPATVRIVDVGVYEGNRPGDRYVGLRWKLADGRWVQLISSGPSTEDDVLRFARGLRSRNLPAGPAPFTVAAAPPDLVLQQLSQERMCLAPRAAAADRDGSRGICIGLMTASADEDPFADEELFGGAEPVTVAGRPGMVTTSGTTLTARLDPERYLTVDVNQADVPLTRDELIRFAEGVAVNGP